MEKKILEILEMQGVALKQMHDANKDTNKAVQELLRITQLLKTRIEDLEQKVEYLMAKTPIE